MTIPRSASLGQGLDRVVDGLGAAIGTPVKALLYSAVLNGLVAPPLIVVLLLICNNRKIVGKNANGWLSNSLGWLAVVIMSLAGGLLIWSLFSGKAA